jgi:hypothetical protein
MHSSAEVFWSKLLTEVVRFYASPQQNKTISNSKTRYTQKPAAW